MDNNGKFVPRNWKNIDANTLKKMDPVRKSKYLAYEDPPKDIAESQAASKKRLIELRKQEHRENPPIPMAEQTEREKHEKLIGQLKAAEARNRLRIMRLRYTANRGEEIQHLIGCQPTALKSVRLQALLPSDGEKSKRNDKLNKLERQRVENLLEDKMGLLTNRT